MNGIKKSYADCESYIHSARNKDQKLVGRFLKMGYFIGYYTAVLLRMYGKFGYQNGFWSAEC